MKPYNILYWIDDAWYSVEIYAESPEDVKRRMKSVIAAAEANQILEVVHKIDIPSPKETATIQ